MEEQKRRPAVEAQNYLNDELDQLLDAALATFAAIEPRPGLEQRILANLRVEKKQAVAGTGWKWSLAAAALVAVAAMALAWRSNRPPRQVITHHVPVTVQGPEKSGVQIATGNGNAQHPAGHGPIHKVDSPPTYPQAMVAANPKLDQFPTPLPLTEQERILASYVAQYPEHAAVVAEARMDDLRRDDEERREVAAGKRD